MNATQTNGAIVLNGDAHSALPSPLVNSPTTPASDTPAPNVKIDIDYQDQESDARHEPLPVKIDQGPVALHTSLTPPIDDVSMDDPPHHDVQVQSERVEDVQMEELKVETNGHANGNGNAELDQPMDVQTPATTSVPSPLPAASSSTTIDSNPVSTPYSTPNDCSHNDDARPPPAKRARMHYDNEESSLAHSPTPPPAQAVPVNGTNHAPPTSSSTLSASQLRYCLGTIRTLKRMKEAQPFLHPVDPIALNIPHYPSIIKNPMDFGTIDHKLASSNLAKPDHNLDNPRYRHVDEFISDVRLIFSNCVTFNGPDHPVTAMGKRVEEVFDKQIKQMPALPEPKPPVVAKKPATPPPVVAQKPTKAMPARRSSTSVPVIRRSDTEIIGRPKREIHPPPPKDLPYADAPKKHRKNKRAKDDGTSEQLKFCAKMLQDLHRKQHYTIASPFYEPVDWVALEIPTYPKVVKKPMDMSTMRKKLESHEYSNASKFYDDFKLMIRNCFLFNPAGTPVNQAGIELQRLFDDKWKNLPPLRDVSDDDDDDDDEEDTDEERTRTIAIMESQIETMRGSIAALKGSKPAKEKKKKDKRDKAAPVASGSKSSKPKASKKKGKKAVADDDVLTFEQKKDLSEAIGKLEGAKLEKVVQIIHEGVPEIRDSTEEIELEIDLLPAAVLTKLYNSVLRPLRTTTKRSRTGKGTGTGGLKRRSMDEEVEAEKIRQLEERMRLFDGHTASVPTAVRQDDSESDSSSVSDLSGSDSE